MIPFVLAVSLAAAPVASSSIVVADPVCLGAGDAACVALPVLLRSRLATAGVTVLPVGPESAPCADSTCAARIAEQAGAHAVVTLLAVRAGSGVLLDVTLVERDGHVAFSERTELAAESDLDPLSRRLVTSLVERVPLASTITPATVTSAEAHARNLRIHPAILLGANLTGSVGDYGEVHQLSGAEATLWCQLERLLVLAAAGTAEGRTRDVRASESYIDAGVFRFLGEGDTAPFAGAGIGRHTTRRSDRANVYGDRSWDSRAGNALWIGGGVMLLRTTHMNLFVLGRYTVDAYNVPGQLQAHGLTIGAGASIRTRL